MPHTPDELRAIAARTLDHYRERAEAFREGTRDHDVSQNVGALLAHIEGPPPYSILDLGCGPGRDLATFARLGHRATGIDALAEFVAMARTASDADVWQQDFLALELPPAHFDGVFANASLFHVPSQALPRVLGELRASLKPRGVLFSSNPHGNDDEGWNRGRYGVYYRLATWQRLVEAAGFDEIEHYYRPPGLPRAEQPWLASVWCKR
ncbi:MAG: class I SAM-dependent methyltransferase [Casimicrobiaceae bacterium]